MKLYVLAGVAGAGKSTYAHNMMANNSNCLYLSSDRCRIELFSSLKEGNSRKNNAIVFEKLHKDLKSSIEIGVYDNIIYDATNISRNRRRSLYRNVKQWSNNEIEVEIVYFSLPLIELLENNECRAKHEPEKEVPEDRDENIIEKYTKNKAVIEKPVIPQEWFDVIKRNKDMPLETILRIANPKREEEEKFVKAWLAYPDIEIEQEPKYYAKIKGHELTDHTRQYWYFFKVDESLNIGMKPNHPLHIGKLNKIEWANLGITDDNADFVKVEELEE